MTASNTTTVLIAGAGPTGLTLACELARRGVSHRIIDAAPGPQPGSRGKGVQPRTLEVFEDLGIIDQVLAHGRLAMPMNTIAPDGTVTPGGAEPQELRNRPDIPYTTSLITPQWRVEEALRARLEELGGRVEFGTALDSFDQQADGVTAVLTKGSASEIVTARWLVGADGGHSAVRRQAGIGFAGDTREEIRMIVADVAADGLDGDAWHMWRAADGLMALCPLPSTGLFAYQASISPGQDASLSRENLQATLERRTGRSDIRLHEPAWVSLWRANVRLAGRYRDGGVFLAGDAAHVHSPAGGQGMNTGIQDAHNLGWKLAAVHEGADPGLLDSYEAERRPVAASVLELSDAILGQAIRDRGISTRRDESHLQLDVGYRWSGLACDDRGEDAALRAGDRAPDATQLQTASGTHRLFDLIRGGVFTLLVFGGTPVTLPPNPHFETQTLRVVGQPAAQGEIADTAGHLARSYGATERTLVLLRPDGFIGAISDAGDQSVITGYLARLG